MRDPENTRNACAALSVAIAESAEEIHALSAMSPGKGGYARLARQLARHAADITTLTGALLVMARPVQRVRNRS